jgi:hypothetical protein
MNRVAPEVMADMDLAALASLGVRDQVGLEAMNLAAREDMNLADLAALASLGVLEDMDLAVPNLAGRADLVALVGLGLRALDPEGREARDLSLGRVLRGRTPTALDRVLLDRMPADLDRMPADLDRMPADLDRTRPAGRLWEPTARVEATRPEARVRLAERTRRVEATRAEATSPGNLMAKASKHLRAPSAGGIRRLSGLSLPNLRYREFASQ